MTRLLSYLAPAFGNIFHLVDNGRAMIMPISKKSCLERWATRDFVDGCFWPNDKEKLISAGRFETFGLIIALGGGTMFHGIDRGVAFLMDNDWLPEPIAIQTLNMHKAIFEWDDFLINFYAMEITIKRHTQVAERATKALGALVTTSDDMVSPKGRIASIYEPEIDDHEKRKNPAA